MKSSKNILKIGKFVNNTNKFNNNISSTLFYNIYKKFNITKESIYFCLKQMDKSIFTISAYEDENFTKKVGVEEISYQKTNINYVYKSNLIQLETSNIKPYDSKKIMKSSLKNIYFIKKNIYDTKYYTINFEIKQIINIKQGFKNVKDFEKSIQSIKEGKNKIKFYNISIIVKDIKQMDNIIIEIEKLVIDNTKTPVINTVINMLKTKHYFNFKNLSFNTIINKPVGMGLSNIYLLNSHKYCVTDKADGLRCFLVCYNNNLILLSGNGEKLFIDKYIKRNNFILDGEYLEEFDKFLVFDVLYGNGQPLINESFDIRYKNMIDIVGDNLNFNVLENSSRKIFLKYFEFDNLKEYILDYTHNRIERIYKTDGLIFTPIEQGYYYNFNRKDGGKDLPILKWKPVELSTIDFYIDKDRFLYLTGKSNDKNHLSNKKEDFKLVPNKLIQYIPVLFNPDENYNIDRENISMCKDIEDKYLESISEFMFDLKTQKWKFMRIREDKMVLLKNKQNFGNSVIVGESIWKNIFNPINIEKFDEYEKPYFSINVSNKIKQITNNYRYCVRIIKNQTYNIVYKQLTKSNNILLEIGAGKFGSLKNWFTEGNKISKVYATEFDKLALEEGMKRLKSIDNITETQKKKVVPYQFNINDDDFVEKLLDLSNGVKYDVVVLHLMIHYTNDLYGLFEKLNKITQKNSFIIITCMDGLSVFDVLKKQKGHYKFKINNKTIGEIKSKYDYKKIKDFNDIDKDLMIDFKFETLNDSFIEEKLVNIDKLAETAIDNNFEVVEYNSFTRLIETKKCDKLSKEENEFLNLYSGLILKKN